MRRAALRAMEQNTIRLLAATLFLWTVAIPDFRTKRIPVWLPAVFFLLAVLADLRFPFGMRRQELWAGAIPGVFLLLLSLPAKGKIGEGDGICLLVCGLFTGITQAVLIAEAALVLAATAGMICVLTKTLRAEDRIPFVPFLAIASTLLLFLKYVGVRG